MLRETEGYNGERHTSFCSSSKSSRNYCGGGMMELRIGVFVCDCGTNIAGFVDVPAVCEYAKTLPNVVFVQENMYTCSDAGITEIREAIKKHNLNRVVVASCTPRTHEPLFRKTCEEAGLNKYLFEFANIRDQCSWVHQKERDKATEKAKDLVRMAVARASLLEPLEEIKVPVERKALVIGGGISGMTASLSLAKQGFEVYLVEKENVLGGMLRHLNKLYPYEKNADEVLKEMEGKVKKEKNIHVLLESMVEHVEGYIGDYSVVINGKERTEIKVGTIIVAIGADVYKPRFMYNYGEYENIITQFELEKMLKNGDFPEAKTIVMIQCVGGRGERVRYCSRICCMNSIKNAKLLKEKNPDAKVYVIHKGVQTYGTMYEWYYRKAREAGVRFIRVEDTIPTVSYIEKEDGRLVVGFYQPGIGRNMKIPADLVVLSTPLIARSGAKELSKMLKVPLGQDGFFFEAHVKLRPVDFATDGIYMAGSCRAPADVNECVYQALAAASRAAIPMAKGYVMPEALMPVIDTKKCKGCGICVEVCPYGAMRLVEINGEKKAENLPAACKGCGACGSSCIHKAIEMRHYRDEQIVRQTIAALEEI
ncbi:4Fe-4S ferredoxin [Thermoplasmatales archaeon ex4484_30]|nr:MAG: 4Fe-4S ferredoxin [Thermoplasmatales archaeon ex4484_30]RLF46489.1 MAG: CoB--CoM heterodisulfide reductase iron-sulfur subunit A family protein [Thermoplasmata archaeon]